MSIDNKTKTLIVNQVTKEQYKTLVNNSQLIPTELYVIVDDAHYTEQEIITLLMAKQDVLSAGLGVQIVDNTITFDMSNDFYTKEDITELLATKSNVTEAGYTLEYEENYLNLKTIDGEVLSSIIIKSAPDTDGVTISYNDNKELQTIGQITKNNTPKFSWIGTQEEYDRDLEAGVIDEYTECLITDSVGDILAPVVSFDAPTKLSELANDMNFVVQSDLQSVKDELQADIEAGIDDTNLVHKTGNETIEGFKNFKEKIVIENGLNKGRIAHKPVDTSLEDGYIEFGDNTLVYGKQDVQGEVFDEKHDIFHAGNLVAGNNITITKKNGVYKINGQAGGGTGGGSIDNVDNETIIIQDDGSISAQGVLDQNTEDLTAIKFWSGTLEEYNALDEWDDDTIYNVTDDIVETGTEIGANLSLSNLNEEGEARFDAKADKADTLEGYGITNGLNKNQITNCITEIPQRIKLELTDGVLTLKAGSVLTLPNGFEADGTTPKFDYFTLEEDFSRNQGSTANVDILIFYTTKNQIRYRYLTAMESGTTDLTAGGATLYHTGENKVYFYDASTVISGENGYLPLAIGRTDADGNLISISQVFNGIGYLGSSLWIDKGVKLLIPNGRNEDGTLKNTEITTKKTSLFTTNVKSNNGSYLLINSNEELFLLSKRVTAGIRCYDSDANLFNMAGSLISLCVLAEISTNANAQIDIFAPRNTFNVLSFENKSDICAWSMPSSKYIDLTLGATKTEYTAPANGFVSIVKIAGNINLFMNLINKTKSIQVNSHPTDKGYSARLVIPVCKGDIYTVEYNLTGDTAYFRFIYAEGEI